MQKSRSVEQAIPSEYMQEGILNMKQPLPTRLRRHIDPFLLLHHHGPIDLPPDNQGLPFGPHPHRGFETVTFILSGSIEHRDNKGYTSCIHQGGIQWMTAGRGIIHSENLSPDMLRDGGKLELIQLWLNLPSELKMTEPEYQGLQKEQISNFIDHSTHIDLISGNWPGTQHKGPAHSRTDILLALLNAEQEYHAQIALPAEHMILFYILEGGAIIHGKEYKAHTLVHFSQDADILEFTLQSGTRLLLGSGKSTGQPIAAHGPFVMNTMQEIWQAVDDFQSGKMGTWPEE